MDAPLHAFELQPRSPDDVQIGARRQSNIRTLRIRRAQSGQGKDDEVIVGAFDVLRLLAG